MRLSTKLTVSVLLSAAVAAPVLGLAIYASARALLLASLRESAEHEARLTMSSVDRVLAKARQDIQLVAEDRATEAWLERQSAVLDPLLARELGKMAVLTGPWDLLLVLDAAGRVVGSSDGRFLGQPLPTNAVEARAGFPAALRGEVYLSDLVVASLTGRPTVVFAAPIRSESQAGRAVLGAVVGLFAWPAVLQVLDDADSKYRIRLVNRDNLVIGAPTAAKAAILRENLAGQGFLQRVRRQSDPSSSLERHGAGEGGPHLEIFAPQLGALAYRGHGWGVFMDIPFREVAGPINRMAERVAVLSALVAALVTSVFFIIGRRLAQPIGRLTAAVQRMTEGHGHARVEVTSRDEIGLLGRAFNDMAQTLEQNTAALEEELAERQKAEAASRDAKAAAEAASRAKSEFLANMSHEIRTPLNGIIGLTGLLTQTPLTELQQRHLANVKLSGETLLQLINDLLDLAKIEAGRLELEEAEFSLRDELAAALKPFGARASQKGLELFYGVDSDLPDGLVGDSLRLRQVLTNLVGNAFKFTQTGEIVVVVAREAAGPDAGAVLPASRLTLHFSVRDTGIGIAPEKQAKIFEAFAQADGSITRRFGGTGLGLAICAQVVGKMGGRIWVESPAPPGGRSGARTSASPTGAAPGSIFHFTAQLQVAAAAARLTAPAPAVDLQGVRVLVVDDHAPMCAMLEELLQSWGLQPSVAADGAAALRVWEQAAADGQPFALVLLDLDLPELNGVEVARTIRSAPPPRRGEIIVISKSQWPGDFETCRSLGVAAFLEKPFSHSDLLETIQAALSPGAAKLGGTAAPAWLTRVLPDQPAALAPASRPSRVLLAEDNSVNQMVALGLLAPLGHTVVVAQDGREAVAAHEREHFDLILMDVQMPEMDGLTAAAEIRAREPATGRRVPIIALTAHALKDDRARCLAAGMDDYLSKPVRRDALFEKLARWLPVGETPAADPQAAPITGGASAPQAVAPGISPAVAGGFQPTDAHPAASRELPEAGKPAAAPPMAPPCPETVSALSGASLSEEPLVDFDRLREVTDAEPALMRRLVDVYLTQAVPLVEGLAAALQNQSAEDVARLAHKLVGSSTSCGVQAFTQALRELERLGHTGELSGAAPLVDDVHRKFARVRDLLSQFRNTL